MIRRTSLGLAATLMLLGGCGHSAETHLLTLDMAPPTQTVAYAGPPLRVTAVTIPPALDRLTFATTLDATEMTLHDQYEWSASLGMLARTALLRDLAARLPVGTVLPPDSPAGKGTRRVQVAVLSLATTADRTTMEAIVSVGIDGSAQVLRQQVALSRDHPPGQLPGAAAADDSVLLGELADRIAAMVASVANVPAK